MIRRVEEATSLWIIDIGCELCYMVWALNLHSLKFEVRSSEFDAISIVR